MQGFEELAYRENRWEGQLIKLMNSIEGIYPQLLNTISTRSALRMGQKSADSGRLLGFAVLLFFVSDFLLDVLDLDAFLVDVEPKVRIDAHILVSNPNQSKAADQISSPVLVEQFVTGDDEKESCHIMAEAVLASEDEEELS